MDYLYEFQCVSRRVELTMIEQHEKHRDLPVGLRCHPEAYRIRLTSGYRDPDDAGRLLELQREEFAS